MMNQKIATIHFILGKHMTTIEDIAKDVYPIEFEGIEDYRKCYIKGVTDTLARMRKALPISFHWVLKTDELPKDREFITIEQTLTEDFIRALKEKILKMEI